MHYGIDGVYLEIIQFTPQAMSQATLEKRFPGNIDNEDDFYLFIRTVAAKTEELRRAVESIINPSDKEIAEQALIDMDRYNSSMFRYPVFGDVEKNLACTLYALLKRQPIGVNATYEAVSAA